MSRPSSKIIATAADATSANETRAPTNGAAEREARAVARGAIAAARGGLREARAATKSAESIYKGAVRNANRALVSPQKEHAAIMKATECAHTTAMKLAAKEQDAAQEALERLEPSTQPCAS